jgi:hypothetical protein
MVEAITHSCGVKEIPLYLKNIEQIVASPSHCQYFLDNKYVN